MEKKRQEALQRLERLKKEKTDFYKRYPNLLEQLERKIAALKSGTGYKIMNAQYLIPYICGKVTSIQILDIEGKKTLDQIKNQNFTIEDAKRAFWGMIDRLNEYEVEFDFKYTDEKLDEYENYKSDEEKKSVKVRRKEFVEKQKIIHKDIKDRISYLNQYERN
jgi:hypothetical protein